MNRLLLFAVIYAIFSGILMMIYRQLVIGILLNKSLYAEMNNPRPLLFIDPLPVRILIRKFNAIKNGNLAVVRWAAFFYTSFLIDMIAIFFYVLFFYDL